jgi:cysteinyl-tRNA synthetase
MGIKVFNTLSRSKEDFQTLEPGKVKMYCCGPTVYDFLHVGNFRGAVFYNLVRNWLEKSGYQVNYVYNFTDVDDKILNRAVKENKTPKEIAETYIAEFWKDFLALKLKPHSANPRVTEHMTGIIALIERLIGNGKAYVVQGEVFYSIKSFATYGQLSNRQTEDMRTGVRIEVDAKKQDPLDFTLWKPAKPGEQSWPSPWGEGRPGWHIECSCMIHDILGEQIDIHGGGMDLIFPHHENEIAQGEGASGKTYARYWLHNNMFMFSGAKMSKSLGNIRTMRSFLEEFPGEIFKFLVMSVHYRSESDFSQTTIDNSIGGLARIYSALKSISEVTASGVDEKFTSPEVKKFDDMLAASQKNIADSLDDDFNSSRVLAEIFEVVRQWNQKYKFGAKVTVDIKKIGSLVQKFIISNGELMALFQEPPKEFLKIMDQMLIRQKNLDVKEIESLVAQRITAREQKNYTLSDELRQKLTAMGIEVRDAVGSSSWEVIK